LACYGFPFRFRIFHLDPVLPLKPNTVWHTPYRITSLPCLVAHPLSCMPYLDFGGSSLVIVLFVCFVVLGFELPASCLLGRHFATWAMPQPFFVLVIFQVVSCIFPQMILRLWSSYLWPLT
jgi:hypothetical protein